MPDKVVVPVTIVETGGIRAFSDKKIQESIEGAFKKAQANGWKNGIVFEVDIYGNMKTAFAMKVGGHLSFGGFLEREAKGTLTGGAQAIFGW